MLVFIVYLLSSSCHSKRLNTEQGLSILVCKVAKCGQLTNTQTAGPVSDQVHVGLGLIPRTCTSNNCLNLADAASPRTTLWEWILASLLFLLSWGNHIMESLKKFSKLPGSHTMISALRTGLGEGPSIGVFLCFPDNPDEKTKLKTRAHRPVLLKVWPSMPASAAC